MKVVCVEPRLSVPAAKADEWIPIRPATDRFFALGLCRVIVEENRYDTQFLKKDTNAPYLVGPDGFFVGDRDGRVYVWDTAEGCAKRWDDASVKEFALEGEYRVEGVACKPAFQLFKDILKDCTPQKMSEITTVLAQTNVRVAREMAMAAQIGTTIAIAGRTLPLRPASYICYRGASAHKYSTMSNHAFKLVNMLLGKFRSGDFVELVSLYGRIYGRLALTQGVHPETVAVSNSLSRMASQQSGVRQGGGHFNELLPANLENTDAYSSQLESVARVRITKVAIRPEDLPSNSVFAHGSVH